MALDSEWALYRMDMVIGLPMPVGDGGCSWIVADVRFVVLRHT